MTIDFNSIVCQRKEEIVFSAIETEMVMVDLEKGRYYGLDNIAAYIWNVMAVSISVNDILTLLQRKYQVEMEQCKEDTLLFLARLNELNLIDIDNPH